MIGRRKFLGELLTGGVPASLALFGWIQSHPRHSQPTSSLEELVDISELNVNLGTIWSKIKTDGRSIKGGTAFVSIRNTGTQPLSGVRVVLYQHTPSTGYTLLGAQILTIQPGEVRFPRFDLAASVAENLAAQRIQLTASCFNSSASPLTDLSPQSTHQDDLIP